MEIFIGKVAGESIHKISKHFKCSFIIRGRIYEKYFRGRRKWNIACYENFDSKKECEFVEGKNEI